LSPAEVSSTKDIALLPDAGPLITLAYADALDVLFKPGWTVMLVDMVLHEVTRSQTPTSARLAAWAAVGASSRVAYKDLRALPEACNRDPCVK